MIFLAACFCLYTNGSVSNRIGQLFSGGSLYPDMYKLGKIDETVMPLDHLKWAREVCLSLMVLKLYQLSRTAQPLILNHGQPSGCRRA